jgi:hypoxanthine-DNA glycosylase
VQDFDVDVPSIGFAPLVGLQPRILILGSLPGRASLAAGEYYGLPRNAFWQIVAELTGKSAGTGYAERCQALTARGIALWDVCASAERSGSLDSRIRRPSVRLNPIGEWLLDHPTVRTVFFNGQAAANLARPCIGPTAPNALATLEWQVLPSSSPTLASLSVEQKAAIWRPLLRRALELSPSAPTSCSMPA